MARSYGVDSLDDFLNNINAQDAAFDLYVRVGLGYIRSYNLDQYIGQTMNGVKITESGLTASIHLVGRRNNRSAGGWGFVF